MQVPDSHLQIAKAEKLKPLEVELKRLEDLSESIVNDFAYMRAREEEMRDTNGQSPSSFTHSQIFVPFSAPRSPRSEGEE